ncbi:MAG: sigma-54 dependent transcriptional regulator [Desulfobacteraceae bacterium]
MYRILIIDDDPDICRLLSRFISATGYEVSVAHTLKDGKNLLESNDYDLVLLDLKLPDGDGLQELPIILATRSNPEVIIITGSDDINCAELAFKSGAWDYIQKPFGTHDVSLPIARALQYRQEKQIVNTPLTLRQNGIIGSSTELNNCFKDVAFASATDASVLISGETGTGKELFARAIHYNSKRAKGNFCIIDCAALPETLAESILFGHEKGAFTGADGRKDGLVIQAEGGTLFLDEIGDLPIGTQKTLLRCLQEKRVMPLGAKKEVAVDFRLVAATNRDLKKLMHKGVFREDLLYRISAITLKLPPLRERGQDIEEITLEKLHQLSTKYGIGTKGVSQDFFEILKLQEWPGNVRELINVIEYALASAGEDPTLFPKHLPPEYRTARLLEKSRHKNDSIAHVFKPVQYESDLSTLSEYREKTEKSYLLELLDRAKGDRKEACRLSGVSQSRLYGLLKKHNLSGFNHNYSMTQE